VLVGELGRHRQISPVPQATICYNITFRAVQGQPACYFLLLSEHDF
jgi:hypothetical protein